MWRGHKLIKAALWSCLHAVFFSHWEDLCASLRPNNCVECISSLCKANFNSPHSSARVSNAGQQPTPEVTQSTWRTKGAMTAMYTYWIEKTDGLKEEWRRTSITQQSSWIWHHWSATYILSFHHFPGSLTPIHTWTHVTLTRVTWRITWDLNGPKRCKRPHRASCIHSELRKKFS